MKMKLAILCLLFAAAAIHAADAPADAKSASAFAPAEHYQVTVIGDIHFDDAEFHNAPAINPGRQKERERNFAMWQDASRKLLETAGKQTAGTSAFVIQLGDITQGDCDTPELQEGLLRKAFETVKSYFPNLPLIVVKGNHDVRVFRTQNNPAPFRSTMLPLVAGELGMDVPDGGCYAVRKGKDLFLSIDSMMPKSRIVPFVRKALDDAPDCRYVIALMHLPLFPCSVHPSFWLLPGYEEVTDLLETRRAVVLAAHTHTFSLFRRKSEKATLVQLITTSMGNAWKPGGTLKVRAVMDDVLTQWSKTRHGEKIHTQIEALMSRGGTYSGTIYEPKSGFTVLDIDDRRIEARIFTDDSGKPVLTEVLVENH